MQDFAAIVLAGGAGRRLGGPAKPAIPVAGDRMLDRVLRALAAAAPVVVVGNAPVVLPAPAPTAPHATARATASPPVAGNAPVVLPAPASTAPHPTARATGSPPAASGSDVLTTLEDPPGSGPVAATAAGMALLPHTTGHVALVAADLPFLTSSALADLRRRLVESTVDGVLYVDGDGRRQLLCGLWRAAPLRAALDRLSAERGLAGASMRALLAGLSVHEVAWTEPGPPPWFDCDTDEDLRQAEEWAR